MASEYQQHEYMWILFIYFRKAFDVIDHIILISKLHANNEYIF